MAQTEKATDPTPRVVENEDASRFEVFVKDQIAGFADYRTSGTSVALTHTVIDDEFQGHGLGSALAREALDALRAAGKSVLPRCPFIRDWIARHPAYLDLVPSDRRAEFDLPE